MSVILGKLNFQGQLDKADIIQMINESNHFEADDIGFTHDEKCGLAHLKIINTPESVSEKQPYQNTLAQLSISADARIDNRIELLKDLSINNPDTPDSQLILSLYQKYGKACVNHLIGAFAFAIWDKQKNELFCARDQMGVRPFFYYKDAHFFAFASEKRGILAINQLDKSINYDFLINQLLILENPIEHTFYSKIFRLKPAHTLTINQYGEIKTHQYWNLNPNKSIQLKNANEYKEAFLDKFNTAVQRRLRSVKNIGVELSGGLDSSGVAAIAHPLLQRENKNLYCFSMVMPKKYIGKAFPYDEYTKVESENGIIEEFCDFVQIDPKYRINIESEIEPGLSYTKFLDRSLEFSSGLDDRMGPSYHKLKLEAAQKDVGVMLVGFPGDELATSHCKNHHLEYLQRNDFKKFFTQGQKYQSSISLIALWMLKQLYQAFPKQTLKLDKSLSSILLKNKYEAKFQQQIDRRSFINTNVFDKYPQLKKKIEGYYFQTRPLSLREQQKRHFLRANTALRMENSNASTRMHKMETRYPLADIELAEFVLAVPVEQKIKDEYSRLLFRNAMEGLIPDSIRWKAKSSYGATNPAVFIDYRKRHEGVMEWLQSVKHIERFQFIDMDKLIRKAEVIYQVSMNGRGSTKEYMAGGMQGLTHQLLRYMENNPNFKMKF